MGCTASRPEDAGRAAARKRKRQCKERYRLMKDAVRLRYLLAAAHADHLRSLGLVASSLSRFAAGEPLLVSDHTPPAVLVQRPLTAYSPPPLLAIEQEHGQELTTQVGASTSTTRRLVRSEEAEVGGTEVRIVVRHRSLAEVAAAVEEYFVKITVAGQAVSNLLEAGDAELRNMVFGSNSLFCALCCVSAPGVAHDRIDSTVNGGASRSHSSTMEQLLAWEKKLYKEVKARERLKMDHDKKLTELQNQEYSRKIGSDLQQMKAAWDKSRSLLDDASRDVDTSSSAIANVRDNQLAWQLVELCYGTLNMWRAMNQHHETQRLIVQQLRGLGSRPSCEPTSDIHHEATRALEAAMSAWQSSFTRMVKYQRDYVRAIHGWLKLTVATSVGCGDGDDGQRNEPAVSSVATELTAFCDRWRQALDRLHYTDVPKSIKNFMNAIHTIYTYQSDELRVGQRVKRYSRELDRKCRSLRHVEKSYYNSYLPASIGLWHRGRQWRDDDRQVFDARDEVVDRREEIVISRRKVEDEMRRHAKAVDATRSAALGGIQGTLPAIFQAMAAFSASLVHALEAVCRQNEQMQ